MAVFFVVPLLKEDFNDLSPSPLHITLPQLGCSQWGCEVHHDHAAGVSVDLELEFLSLFHGCQMVCLVALVSGIR